jgi:GntR family transcriptional regulator
MAGRQLDDPRQTGAGIDRDSDVPLHRQLRALLEARIAAGELVPGDMLPTEEKLRAIYGVSRTTVRQALRDMTEEGLISRTRGRGTVVTQPRASPAISYHLHVPASPPEHDPYWLVISAGWEPAPPDVAARLRIEPGMHAYRLQRLAMAHSHVVGYHRATVSPAFGGLIDEGLLTVGGTLHYLNRDDALKTFAADRIIEAVPADARVADMLSVEAGAPVMRVQRLVISGEGQPVEDLLAFYRGDRFQYELNNLPAIIPPDG